MQKTNAIPGQSGNTCVEERGFLFLSSCGRSRWQHSIPCLDAGDFSAHGETPGCDKRAKPAVTQQTRLCWALKDWLVWLIF